MVATASSSRAGFWIGLGTDLGVGSGVGSRAGLGAGSGAVFLPFVAEVLVVVCLVMAFFRVATTFAASASVVSVGICSIILA